MKLPPIDFAALNAALLRIAHVLVPAWLPGGTERGGEYQVHSVWRHEKTASLSVRISGERAGQWADFGGTERGKDLISLFAAIHGIDQGQAALQLARENGLEQVAGIVAMGPATPLVPPPRPPAPPPADRPPTPERWATMMPVPGFAPNATFRHHHRRVEDITHKAAYRSDGHLLGYVVRFRTSDGGKETLPYTWCHNEISGEAAWKWRQWDEPRPLYLPGGRSIKSVQGEGLNPPTVIVVEGERKADILQQLLDAGAPGIYVVVSWPGGSKAWKKALWEWLAGCHVLLWPDCDGKREALTKAERDQYPDDTARAVVQASKPLLPAEKQVGMVAMHGLGNLLREAHGCTVQLLPIPAPGEVVDGWDAADAIETDGWDYQAVQAFFARAYALPSGEPDKPIAAPSAGRAGRQDVGGGGSDMPPSGDGWGAGGVDDDDDEFARHLKFLCSAAKCEPWDLPVNRKMVIKALRSSKYLRDCLGYNELTGNPGTQTAWPWRDKAGPMDNNDSLRLGDFLSREYKLKAASKSALQEAIDTVADERRFHPIRDWMETLEHDGRDRVDKWFVFVLGLDPETLSATKLKYLTLVGRFVLLGLVARVMDPGCKFDYSLVLEGKGGLEKSTFFRALVGDEFFSDTHFDIGAGKDGFEQLQGLWGYELSELTALRKADSEQVKQFFSSQSDRFRNAYGHYVQAHPRQCLIFCSTNKRQYLYDLSGNRRFWPALARKPLPADWIGRWRDQLFAEALKRYRAGERYWPTRDEEEEVFEPEQRKRLVVTAVQARLYELLTRDGASAMEGKTTNELSQMTQFVTLDRLIVALGADAAKSTAQLETQVRAWLEANGWEAKREGSGLRRYGFRRPKVWPPLVEPGDDEPDGDEDADESANDGTSAPGAGANPVGGTDGAPF